jgi:putative ABC transport system substrate-binding protein
LLSFELNLHYFCVHTKGFITVPTIYQPRALPAAGGLMSYGGSLTDARHTAGQYAGRILKGEKPGDLPVQQSAKLELLIILKTTKSLGITVPQLLLERADEGRPP